MAFVRYVKRLLLSASHFSSPKHFRSFHGCKTWSLCFYLQRAEGTITSPQELVYLLIYLLPPGTPPPVIDRLNS